MLYGKRVPYSGTGFVVKALSGLDKSQILSRQLDVFQLKMYLCNKNEDGCRLYF